TWAAATSDFRRPTPYDFAMSGGVAPFYDRWGQYNGRLVDAIRRLSDEQLKLRASPTYWAIWAIAAHTAGTRVYWLCGVFKDSGARGPNRPLSVATTPRPTPTPTFTPR